MALINTFRFKSWQFVRMRGHGPYTGSAWRIAAHIYRERAINCMDAIRMAQEDMRAMQDAYTDLQKSRDDLLAACKALLETETGAGPTAWEAAHIAARAAIAKATEG